MTNEVLNELLTQAKLILRRHDDTFDAEITMWLNACEQDLLHRNAIQSAQMETLPVNPSIVAAMLTYVKANFGNIDVSEKENLKADYDEQKATLMTTTGFTDWGVE